MPSMKSGNQFQAFRTGLNLATDRDRHEDLLLQGKAWRTSVEVNKSEREVMIHAKSQRTAQNALDLILHALWLFSGGQPLVDRLLAWNEGYLEAIPKDYRFDVELLKGRSISTPPIPKACRVAARASFRRKYVYALAKYTLSIQMWSAHVLALSPNSPYVPKFQRPIDQVILCQCIVLAYSVVEELGLDVRVSRNKPSQVKGKWDPEVKRDLEERLSAAGIDLSEPFLWTARGPKRRLEIKRESPVIGRPTWACGCVRDGFMNVIDAIARASWLRSKVASHKVGKLTTSLSIYDVDNVQSLALRFLLESLRA